jgi:hypothetical protein
MLLTKTITSFSFCELTVEVYEKRTMTGHCELAHSLNEVESRNLAVSFAISNELHLSDIRNSGENKFC